MASYSQQSQRYVSLLTPDYVVPITVKGKPEAEVRFREAMEQAWNAYQKLAELIPVEDARYVLPNACTTNIIGHNERTRASALLHNEVL